MRDSVCIGEISRSSIVYLPHQSTDQPFTMSRAVLVTGATGKQGGAVVKSLLQARADFAIIAVTRNPSSPAAQKLKALAPDISLVRGDLSDAQAIFTNAKEVANGPIWGVYSIQARPLRTLHSTINLGR